MLYCIQGTMVGRPLVTGGKARGKGRRPVDL